jgi:hypothetical protein
MHEYFLGSGFVEGGVGSAGALPGIPRNQGPMIHANLFWGSSFPQEQTKQFCKETLEKADQKGMESKYLKIAKAPSFPSVAQHSTYLPWWRCVSNDAYMARPGGLGTSSPVSRE